MNAQERITATLCHQQPDKLPVDFEGGNQTGIHVSMVYQLRQALGLDKPDTPVQVVEVHQMLGEIAPDLQDALGIDTVQLAGTGTIFGFPRKESKAWRMNDGTPVLVPVDLNTQLEPDGRLLQYPGADRSVPASGEMPAGGYFFDATKRQPPIVEEALNPADNMEEFVPIAADEVAHYGQRANQLYSQTSRALFCAFGGLSFGDVALVPAPFLKHPKGIRDVEEWYVSTVSRQDYIQAVFEYQAEMAIKNLERLHQAVGDRIAVIQTNGTDFGAQNGPLLSVKAYRRLFLPYQKKVNGWIHKHTNWKTFMHCCGGIWPLLDSIVEAEFDILNPVQCSAKGMDPRQLKKQYGRQLTFWGGGVDTQRVLPFGTPQQVRDQVRERIDILAEGGGFVFCSIHNVQARTPIKNLLALFETIQQYR
jgi:hypothetical protein